ncbi:MAG: pyridoxal phosphate-dependent aminotransferase [candidate division KSB1 bacterium]|nr:pyridoxal phosphate-dependent aminotransferase [candidate division KSB1 bacterium]MDZ7303816.1 pyridoxal phosphate-dependent aminotransferase [candidate division KSB1 bacterium]MDZ7314173.1 pyridoxal phosphate-dependent aminotransferase [candidate division KSB1 bacterium]
MNARRQHFFSSRFTWDLQPNRLSQRLEEKRQRGENIFDLTESNPTVAGFDYPVEEILHALAQPQALCYEPTPRGLLMARQAIAEYYHQRGVHIDPDRVHLTVSTSEAYMFLFKLLTDSGQNVLVPQPSYPLFEFLAGFEGVELVPYQLVYHKARSEWRIDFESIAEAINSLTRAIILVNPNNPTGAFVKRDELAELNRLCAEHGLALIVDEVFFDYVFETEANRMSTLAGNSEVMTFVLSGLSKILGLPQMKLGWIVINGPEDWRLRAQEYLDLIADTYLSVSTPIQHATPYWLKLLPLLQSQISDRVKANLAFLQTQLTNYPNCHLLRPEGGWYVVIEIPSCDSEEEFVLAALEHDNVLVHPGYFFDFPGEGFLVLSLLPKPEFFQEGIRRLLARIELRQK